MVLRRIFAFSLTLVLLLSPLLSGMTQGSARGFAQPAAAEPQPAMVHLLRADEKGVLLELNAPDFEITTGLQSPGSSQKLTLPGADSTSEPGSPQLPMVSVLIGVPPDAQVEVQLVADEAAPLEGRFDLAPAPGPAPLEDDFQPGTLQRTADLTAYTRAALYPVSPVQIADDAWVRGQRVVRVAFYPFQYDPVHKTVLWHQKLRVAVQFNGSGAPSACGNACPAAGPFEPMLQNALLNYDQAQAWRVEFGTPQAAANLSAGSYYRGSDPAYEIVVDQDGIYRVTYADLQAAGVDVNNIDPATFRLTSQGDEVAIYVAGEGDGSFDPGDYLTFYGEQFRGDRLAAKYSGEMLNSFFNPANNWLWLCRPNCDLGGVFERYTDDNVYWLTVGGTPGPRMGTVDGTPSGTAAVPDYYYATARAEESEHWWSWEFANEDVWFWDRIRKHISQLPYTTTYPITLTAVATGAYTATVHAEVASRKQSDGTPDHHTIFTLNSDPQPLDDAYWDGRMRYSMDAQVSQSNLVEGRNELHFSMWDDVSDSTTDMYFDFFEITYARKFQAENDQLAFTHGVTGTWQYETTNFITGTIEVYDITAPLTPTRVLTPSISGSGGVYTATFETTHSGDGTYLVVGAGALKSPKSIAYYVPPDFAAMPEADYVFITHRDFLTGTQALADYRTSQGMSTAVIDVDDLYKSFNYGIYHPIAIKHFLAYTFENWASPPAYVLLVGGGNWNFKGDGASTYGTPPIYMPPNLAYIDPWQGEVDSANLLATLVGDDTMPDLAIGRLPVSSAAEMNVVVGKITAYEQAPLQDWQRRALFIADNTPDAAGDFIALSEAIITEFLDPEPAFQADRLYLNEFGCYTDPITGPTPGCNDVTYAITNTLNITGSLLVNYIGHASLDRWTDEKVFANEDIPTLNNNDRLPVVLSMTCLDGYWIHPTYTSLAENFLTTAGRGAVATFSPTGLGVATGHGSLHHGFYASLFYNDAWDMGSATLNAKLELFKTGANQDLMHTFTIFGDPALRINGAFNQLFLPLVVKN